MDAKSCFILWLTKQGKHPADFSFEYPSAIPTHASTGTQEKFEVWMAAWNAKEEIERNKNATL